MASFSRIAVVDRGESAMRLIRAVRELNHPRGEEEKIRTIALYGAPDRGAMFVRQADEAVDLGPASARRDLVRLASALEACRADAAWVGSDTHAHRAALAELCEHLGVAHI